MTRPCQEWTRAMDNPSQYFRAGVGTIIVNHQGLVLSLERTSMTGAWQLPQGGLKTSEEPLHAVFREVEEETGIPESALELVEACPEPLAYELPAAARSDKTGRGQVLYWFLFTFQDGDDLVNVTHGTEFRRFRWTTFDRVVEDVANFRKPLYRRLASQFQTYLTAPSADDRPFRR